MSLKVEPFLYSYIIKNKSDNIILSFNKPKFKKVVLKNNKPYEGICNAYYTIIYDNNEYKMYYRANNQNIWKNEKKKIYKRTPELAKTELFCLATSKNGLDFKKNNYKLVKYKNNKKNNILLKNNFCHNFYPFFLESKKKFYGVSGTQLFNKGLFLFESKNGINWIKKKKIINETDLLQDFFHKNHFDSHNNIVYNKNEDLFYIYMRDNKKNRRFVQFTKTKDFVKFSKVKNINIKNENGMEIYTPNIFIYPDSDYFISIPTIRPDRIINNVISKKCNTLLISKDGENWEIINNQLFDDSQNRMFINSFVKSPDKKEIFFYLHENISNINNHIKCYSYEINRIHKIFSKEEGFIQTELINLKNNIIKINFKTIDNGYINVNIYNSNNDLILYSKNNSGNFYDLIINWEKNLEINGNYYIKFNLCNCYLYSFLYFN